MTEKRNIGIYFKFSEKEQEIIHKKIAILGTQNQSAYIRKMAIDGYAVRFGEFLNKQKTASVQSSAEVVFVESI